jgi:hypothetical protein
MLLHYCSYYSFKIGGKSEKKFLCLVNHGHDHWFFALYFFIPDHY